jgi:6-phosphogluconolactonase
MSNQSIYVYIGSYAEADTPGIYVCQYDEQKGSLTELSRVQGLRNPTFLEIDKEHRRLYAIADQTDSEGRKYGCAAAYQIEEEQGSLSLINEERTVSAPTCHITLDRTARSAMVSSYHGGMIGISPILENGRLGPLAEELKHEGSSVLPVQSQARAHSIFIDPANRFAIVCDLGLDQLIVYRLDPEHQRMIPHDQVHVTPGAGPRHFVFHPSRSLGYVINELNSTITAYSYDGDLGKLVEIQSISTLPDDYQGNNACADIHISPDGKFLYGSNRGHDSIVVYAIEAEKGTLTLVEHHSTLGQHPRNFAISLDGRYLLVANRDTDNVVSLSRDSETGKLSPTGLELHVSKPVCVKFYES